MSVTRQCRDCGEECDDRDLTDGRCEGCREDYEEREDLRFRHENAGNLDDIDRANIERHGDLIDGVGFQDPGGNSALRRATRSNPRNLPCPTCKRPNMLTPADVRAHYQCNFCADRDEGVGP